MTQQSLNEKPCAREAMCKRSLVQEKPCAREALCKRSLLFATYKNKNTVKSQPNDIELIFWTTSVAIPAMTVVGMLSRA